jgi:putative transcriptional regulator
LSKVKVIIPGDVIVSSPSADTGIVFSKSVIYILSHDKAGTTGIIINKLLNKEASNETKLPVYFGGPIEQEKGIILHSSDYSKNSLLTSNQDILVNIDTDIINDIITGKGPKHSILILGYSAWSPGQLVEEIKRNDWLLPIKPLDKQMLYNLLFIEDSPYRWNTALGLAGINLGNYTNFAGHA